MGFNVKSQVPKAAKSGTKVPAKRGRKPAAKILENKEQEQEKSVPAPSTNPRLKKLAVVPKVVPVSQEEANITAEVLKELKENDKYKWVKLQNLTMLVKTQKNIQVLLEGQNSAIVVSNGQAKADADTRDKEKQANLTEKIKKSLWDDIREKISDRLDKRLELIPESERADLVTEAIKGYEEEPRIELKKYLKEQIKDFITHKRSFQKDGLHQTADPFYEVHDLDLDSKVSYQDLLSTDIYDQKQWDQLYSVAWHILILRLDATAPVEIRQDFTDLQCEWISKVWLNYKSYNCSNQNPYNVRSLDFRTMDRGEVNLADDEEEEELNESPNHAVTENLFLETETETKQDPKKTLSKKKKSLKRKGNQKETKSRKKQNTGSDSSYCED